MATPLDRDIAEAQRVAEDAQALREDLRWSVKPGTTDRQRAIGHQLDAIDRAMKPIRSRIGGLIAHPLPAADERRLRQVSKGLQYERKQLKKMRRS